MNLIIIIFLLICQISNPMFFVTEHFKEALENECAKCTDVQKKGIRRVVKHLINHENDYWNELTAKFDPDRKFTEKYEKELKELKE